MIRTSKRPISRPFKLSGLIAAPHAPFRANGDLNLAMIEKQAALLLDNGVTAALAVIVHTGHNGLRDARALASHAQRVGASATSALPPMYFKPSGVAAAVKCAAAAAAASA